MGMDGKMMLRHAFYSNLFERKLDWSMQRAENASPQESEKAVCRPEAAKSESVKVLRSVRDYRKKTSISRPCEKKQSELLQPQASHPPMTGPDRKSVV